MDRGHTKGGSQEGLEVALLKRGDGAGRLVGMGAPDRDDGRFKVGLPLHDQFSLHGEEARKAGGDVGGEGVDFGPTNADRGLRAKFVLVHVPKIAANDDARVHGSGGGQGGEMKAKPREGLLTQEIGEGTVHGFGAEVRPSHDQDARVLCDGVQGRRPFGLRGVGMAPEGRDSPRASEEAVLSVQSVAFPARRGPYDPKP